MIKQENATRDLLDKNVAEIHLIEHDNQSSNLYKS